LGTITETYYFNNGTLDFGYRFDYTNRDVDLYGWKFTIRISEFQAQSGNSNCDCARKLRQVNKQKSYADVITALNLKDSQIEKINL
jgi:hypothetical protein